MNKPLEFVNWDGQWVEKSIYTSLMYTAEHCNDIKNPNGQGQLRTFQAIMRDVYQRFEPMILELNELRRK